VTVDDWEDVAEDDAEIDIVDDADEVKVVECEAETVLEMDTLAVEDCEADTVDVCVWLADEVTVVLGELIVQWVKFPLVDSVSAALICSTSTTHCLLETNPSSVQNTVSTRVSPPFVAAGPSNSSSRTLMTFTVFWQFVYEPASMALTPPRSVHETGESGSPAIVEHVFKSVLKSNAWSSQCGPMPV
jgi:hypothetical protein